MKALYFLTCLFFSLLSLPSGDDREDQRLVEFRDYLRAGKGTAWEKTSDLLYANYVTFDMRFGIAEFLLRRQEPAYPETVHFMVDQLLNPDDYWAKYAESALYNFSRPLSTGGFVGPPELKIKNEGTKTFGFGHVVAKEAIARSRDFRTRHAAWRKYLSDKFPIEAADLTSNAGQNLPDEEIVDEAEDENHPPKTSLCDECMVTLADLRKQPASQLSDEMLDEKTKTWTANFWADIEKHILFKWPEDKLAGQLRFIQYASRKHQWTMNAYLFLTDLILFSDYETSIKAMATLEVLADTGNRDKSSKAFDHAETEIRRQGWPFHSRADIRRLHLEWRKKVLALEKK